MNECWQGDLQRIFEKVLSKQIGWSNIVNAMFQKAKDRNGIIHFYKRVIDDPRFPTLPPEVREKISGPRELVVSITSLASMRNFF